MNKDGKKIIGLISIFLFILASFIVLLTITSGKQHLISELPTENPNPPLSLTQCKSLCAKNYTIEVKNCSNAHRNAIRHCNELKKQMLDECSILKGKERQTCVKNAEVEGKRCKENSLENLNICKNEARKDLMFCKSLCEPITCCLNDSECFKTTITQCRNEKGAVMECLPTKHGGKPRISQSQNFTLFNTTAQSDWLKNLTDIINSTNISSAPYVPGNYVCHNFTDDLERNLTAAGYNATFTAYWCYNNAGNPTVAHAVTDVHAPDGSLLFIEPQTGQITNLDFDSDGNTEARTHHENAKKLTDDNCEIEVYDNKAAALAAGVPM
ncbi:hypothetical protein HYW75_03820 [Candidatus Pacearchaeota archaeon]|nr:hypothetical protein [Candidatus Pacearchaeota archaeon]